MSLQNHIGDLELPVRRRWRYVRLVTDLRRRVDPRAEGRRNLIAFLVPALPAGAAAIVAEDVWFPEAAAGTGIDTLGPPLVAGALLGFLGLLAAALPRVGRPLRDQRRYLRWTGLQPVTAAQQSLLALDAPSDHASRAWNSSLAYQPAWALLPQDVRARWDDGRRGQALQSLVMTPTDVLRRQLDEHYRVVTADDVRLAIADRFADRGASARLREVLGDPRAVARIAGLTGEDEPALEALGRPAGDRPAPLVWAADVQHVVLLVRMASMAGVLDAAEAWQLLARAGDVAAAVYPGWDEYDRGLLVGLALESDGLEAVDGMRRAIAEVRSGRWPAARAAFPAPSGATPLPPAVLGR